MNYNNLLFIPDSYLKDDNINNKRPFRARNTISRKNSSAVFTQETTPEQAPQEQAPIQQPELPPGDVPAMPAQPGETPEKAPVDVGYISVGVFTASGALPVEDAVVTVYRINSDGEENVIYNVVTDASGQVPTLELPVIYNPRNPLVSPEFYFTTYNLRVQAINYYTFNLLDIRVFPDTTTSFTIDLIPVAVGPGGEAPSRTVVIPPSPIDESNE